MVKAASACVLSSWQQGDELVVNTDECSAEAGKMTDILDSMAESAAESSKGEMLFQRKELAVAIKRKAKNLATNAEQQAGVQHRLCETEKQMILVPQIS